jgi:very-short-patch-repair endonuclease
MHDYARHLRRHATEAERLLWSRLRRRQVGGCKFRRQRSIGPYVCDFVCLEASVIVELDGSQHAAQATYDDNRDHYLRSIGYRVLRFWNVDVFARVDSVVETIFEALQHPDMDGRFD